MLDAKLSHIMPQVASMGAAVSVVDFDRDGWPDIYMNSGEGTSNALYRNLGRRHVSKTLPRKLGIADVNQPAPASPWARSGATTTTTATKTCSSTSGAGRNCSTTTAASASRA